MIISGKELSAKLKAEMAERVATFPAEYGRVPHLVVILVGEDPGSVSYVKSKAKLRPRWVFAIPLYAAPIPLRKMSCWV